MTYAHAVQPCCYPEVRRSSMKLFVSTCKVPYSSNKRANALKPVQHILQQSVIELSHLLGPLLLRIIRRRKAYLTTDDIPSIVKAVVDALPRAQYVAALRYMYQGTACLWINGRPLTPVMSRTLSVPYSFNYSSH